MLFSSPLNIFLCLFVCFMEIKIASLQQSSISSTQTDIQIDEIANYIRSNEFTLAQGLINKLNDNNKIGHIIHNAYKNEEDSFDVIFAFAKALHRVDLTFHVLKALRNEMVANGHRDPMKMIPLGRAFGDDVVFQKNNDEIIEAEAKNIIKDVRVDVKSTATEILTEAMFSSYHYFDIKAMHLAKEVFNFFYDLSDEIMREMVNRTYPCVAPIQIVQVIMRSSNYIPQKVSVFLEVFKKLEDDNDLNNEAVLELANYINQLKEERNYENLFDNQKYDVNVVIDKLPACARNLYFAREFCIWNRGKLEYLYAYGSQNYSSRRSVYTSPPDVVKTGEGAWAIEKLVDDFLFKSQAFKKEYLGVTKHKYESLGHYAQTNEKDIDDESNTWKIELIGEYCFIKNQNFNEYLFASDQMHDTRERYVFSASANATVDPINFQWQIRDCS